MSDKVMPTPGVGTVLAALTIFLVGLAALLLFLEDPKSTKQAASPSKPVARVHDDGPSVCAPCIGPHLNLSNGKIGYGLSMGPGIQF